MLTVEPNAEWIEADGLGGFASGTVSGIRTRRYHALLLVARTPPSDRFVLVNGVEAWVETPAGKFALSSERYAPDVTYPDGATRIVSFESEPWPRWRFALEDGTEIEQEIFVPHGSPMAVVSWRLVAGKGPATLSVRPMMSGRGHHALHHENPGFHFDADQRENTVEWRPYESVPPVTAVTNGMYFHQPEWYRQFLYEEEKARGLDDMEDLASPGTFLWDLADCEALLVFTTDAMISSSVASWVAGLRTNEKRRRARLPTTAHRSAAAYLVRRGDGRTVIAGYPWFADWGRDTFIALRGLGLATGRLDETREILIAWAATISEGMTPNRFPDHGGRPEFNSVDASLWYVIVANEFLAATAAAKHPLADEDRETLDHAMEAILSGYARGTRYGIRLDGDGLLAAGQHGVQLTWMDAKVGDWVVTPRIGKPVEVAALWLNAVHIGRRFSQRWEHVFEQGKASFVKRFWNERGGYLHDVVDVDHQAGTSDPSFRPNQIFAVGGLPLMLLEGTQAASVVKTVEEKLWTPMGLRTLAPGSVGYRPRYEGGPRDRDAAYHQGTAWPWLLGPFVEAWLRVNGDTPARRTEAAEKFIAPIHRHLKEAGLGHISEIADGDPPHTPRGCPFQAWSMGEFLRLGFPPPNP